MNEKKIITIAVDGYSSCGKSTVAKQLAKHFNFIYVDTGAMYRSVSLYFLRNEIDYSNSEQVEKALQNIKIEFKLLNNSQIVHLNNEAVEGFIRNQNINNIVSDVAKISLVRRKMVELQRFISQGKSVVMDGRDIGTVVFPNADLKFFITADIETRVQRRYDELQLKSIPGTKDEVRENLQMRDLIDSTRKDSPLRKAEDAMLIDNTNLNKEEQFNKLVEIINKYRNAND